jgi:hypothetical protein
MSDAPRIIYTKHADTLAETELNALTRVYRLVLFESNARKKAAEQASSPNMPDGRDSAAVGDRKKGGSRVDQSKETKEQSHQVTTKGT